MFSENETIPTMGSYYTVNKIQFCASQRNNSYCFVMICRCLCWAIKALILISNIRYLNEFLKTKWLCLCFLDVCNSVPYCTREEHSSHLNRKKCNDSLWSKYFMPNTCHNYNVILKFIAIIQHLPPAKLIIANIFSLLVKAYFLVCHRHR